MSPGRILLFLVIVALSLTTIALLFPQDGIHLGKQLELRFVSKEELLAQKEKVVVDITDAQHLADSLEAIESFPDAGQVEEQIIPDPGSIKQRLEWGSNGRASLNTFFAHLDSLTLTGGSMRIMHYGDSQIEADRMTSYLRDKFQRYFGGRGPGLVPVISFSNPAGIKVTTQGNWEQYGLFGNLSGKGMTFGPLFSFASMCKQPADSAILDTTLSASAAFQAGSALYSNARSFNRVRVFYSNSDPDATITVEAGGEQMVRSLDTSHTMFTMPLGSFANTLSFTVQGNASTHIQGVSLESQSGVVVDNIPLRGSSGTIFTQGSRRMLADAYRAMGVDMFILQFGGNVMPYIEDEQACINYGNWFASQIKYLKSIRPDAVFIVIGPSDMSTKIGTEYVTYPLLPNVRDALRKAALQSGAAYFDLFEAMGGENSMQAWVNADPPLAAPDYTHFSSRGARLMGEMFYEALMSEYHQYKSDNGR